VCLGHAWRMGNRGRASFLAPKYFGARPQIPTVHVYLSRTTGSHTGHLFVRANPPCASHPESYSLCCSHLCSFPPPQREEDRLRGRACAIIQSYYDGLNHSVTRPGTLVYADALGLLRARQISCGEAVKIGSRARHSQNHVQSRSACSSRILGIIGPRSGRSRGARTRHFEHGWEALLRVLYG